MTVTKKVAVITGVSSGLGIATAKKFRDAGIIVAGLSRTKPDTELDFWMPTDITITEQRAKAIEEITNRYGRIDILINNAGIGGYSTWEDLQEDEIRKIFELNFFAMVELTRICLPYLKNTQGSVINISSVAGRLYVPCMGAYCATKAAVTAYSNTLRVELHQYGIHVMDVTPGRIDTGFSSRAIGNRHPPRSPGGGNPEIFAARLLQASQKRKRCLTYPGWNILAVPFVLAISRLYDWQSLKIWRLEKK